MFPASFPIRRPVLTGIVAAALAAPALADDLRAKTYIRNTGTSQVGARLVCTGEMRQSAALVKAYGGITGYARLFGRYYEAMRFSGHSQVKNGRSTNTLSLRIVGSTLFHLSLSKEWHKRWPKTFKFFDRNRTFTIMALPINLELKVNGTLYLDLRLGLGVAGAGFRGKLGAKAWGSATAAYDTGLYRAGVRSNITLFNNWLQGNLTAGYFGIRGELSYNCNPLVIDLELVIDKAKWRRKKKGWRWKWYRTWTEKLSYRVTKWRADRIKRVLFAK